MRRADDGQSVALANLLECQQQVLQSFRMIDIFRAVDCHQEVLPLANTQVLQDTTLRDALRVLVDHLFDWIACHENAITGNAFAQEVLPAALRVRQ
jgi:hypothetical protein